MLRWWAAIWLLWATASILAVRWLSGHLGDLIRELEDGIGGI
jgi:hypothetical protein